VPIEIADSLQRLESLADEWSRLAQACPQATPFHLPEWLLPWWCNFGSGNLHCVLQWEAGRIIGLLPSFSVRWEGHKQLTLVGSGISDYLEPLVPEKSTPDFVSALLTLDDWGTANWQDLNHSSPWLEKILWQPVAGFQSQPDMPCSSIRIAGDFTSYWQSRGKDLRRNLRRYRDRAEQTAPLAFAISEQADTALMDSLIHLHAARWSQRGEPGTIAANNACRFLEAMAPRMAKKGLLRIFHLSWSGRVAAISLGFSWRSHIYSYLSAFDPEFEPLGFGRLLLYESLRSVWSSGYTQWRFLRGEERYKQSWGAMTEPKMRLLLERT
jgi:CelD/BcsL family acetyltransferase involved in cellulose biosynthesis